MQIFKVIAKTGRTGKVKVDFPTPLISKHVEIVMIVQPAQDGAAKPTRPSYDFTRLVGKLHWTGDACQAQRSLRNEW